MNYIYELEKLAVTIEGCLKVLKERPDDEAAKEVLDNTYANFTDIYKEYIGEEEPNTPETIPAPDTEDINEDADEPKEEDEDEIDIVKPEESDESYEPQDSIPYDEDITGITLINTEESRAEVFESDEPQDDAEADETSEHTIINFDDDGLNTLIIEELPGDENEDVTDNEAAQQEITFADTPQIDIVVNEEAEAPQEAEVTEDKENSNEEETTDSIPKINYDYTAEGIESVNENLRVDEMLSRREASDLRKAFTLNDKFRFRRDLFNGNDAQFVDTVNIINAMKSYDEALSYLSEDLHLDIENEDVKDFLSIIANHFDAK